MNLKDMVSKIAKAEGLKDEVSVGNIREIVGIVSDMIYGDSQSLHEVVSLLHANGKRRSKRKKK